MCPVLRIYQGCMHISAVYQGDAVTVHGSAVTNSHVDSACSKCLLPVTCKLVTDRGLSFAGEPVVAFLASKHFFKLHKYFDPKTI